MESCHIFSELCRTQSFFRPVSADWQVEKAKKLGFELPTDYVWANAKVVELPSGRRPRNEDMLDVVGDGNCLPRTIAVAVTGRQEPECFEFRRLVVDLLRNKGEDVSNIEEDGAWMSTREILAYSELLDVPIYSCAEYPKGAGNWRYHRHCHSKSLANDDNAAIFIANIPTGKHFQLVRQP